MDRQAYITHEGQIGVRVTFLISSDWMVRGKVVLVPEPNSIAVSTYDALAKRAARTEGLRLREGKGAGNEALFSFNNMPYDWQVKCRTAFGDPERIIRESVYLEQFYQTDFKASDFYNAFRKDNGERLSKELIETYTTNASVLNAVINAMSKRKVLRKSLNGSTTSMWDAIKLDVEALRDKYNHTIKTLSLQRTVAKYKKEGYDGLVSGKIGNSNTAKVVDDNQRAVLQELLKKHNNYDNIQIAVVYNQVASSLGWKSISDSTVAKYRKEFDLYIHAGNSGETSFRNTRSMQVKRRAPNVPMVYWTLDGWDVELLYQKTGRDSDGKKVTTYHNRPTVVVVLDPYLKYPIGYAIGTHESPELIKEALRNAANHTRELFGKRYKSLQIQSDHYGKGKLVPIYEALTKHYTPARVRNSKAKIIEPYFKELNKDLQLISPNWSGYGVTAAKGSQPNSDYLNKIRHSFPDFEGVSRQIEHLIAVKRMKVVEQYVARWHEMADADHVELTDEEYLYLFGETTGYTNKLHHNGVTMTLNKTEYVYDSFDLSFRENKHVDWCLKYDPNDLSKVLAVNAIGKDGRFKEEIGTLRFVLEEKYVQPMALHERNEGDGAELAKIARYNDMIEDKIIERNIETRRHVEQLFIENPQLNGTLSKLVLIDSNGQHKDQRNSNRQQQLQTGVEKITIKQQRKIEQAQEEQIVSDRKAYLEGKVNLDELLNI